MKKIDILLQYKAIYDIIYIEKVYLLYRNLTSENIVKGSIAYGKKNSFSAYQIKENIR